jgi:hypothetical protein
VLAAGVLAAGVLAAGVLAIGAAIWSPQMRSRSARLGLTSKKSAEGPSML